jgi:hypothetical protein
MFVAPREGLLVRLLLVSDSLVRLFGSSGFESGSERSRFPWLASIAVFFGRIWDVLAGWLGGDLGAAPNTHLGCALGCSERTLVVSVASMLCLWFVLGLSLMCLWCVSGVSLVRLWVVSGLSLVCLWSFSGLSLVCLWSFSGVSLILFSGCFSSISLGCSECALVVVSGVSFSGCSLVCLWSFSGSSLVFLWSFSGLSLVFLWSFSDLFLFLCSVGPENVQA